MSIVNIYGYFPEHTSFFAIKDSITYDLPATSTIISAALDVSHLLKGTYIIGYKKGGNESITTEHTFTIKSTDILPKIAPAQKDVMVYVKNIESLPFNSTYLYDVDTWHCYKCDLSSLANTKYDVGDDIFAVYASENVTTTTEIITFPTYDTYYKNKFNIYINGFNLTYMEIAYLRGRQLKEIIPIIPDRLNDRKMSFTIDPILYDTYDLHMEFYTNDGILIDSIISPTFVSINPLEANPYTIIDNNNGTYTINDSSVNIVYAVQPYGDTLINCNKTGNILTPEVAMDYKLFKTGNYFIVVDGVNP